MSEITNTDYSSAQNELIPHTLFVTPFLLLKNTADRTTNDTRFIVYGLSLNRYLLKVYVD